MQLTWYGLSCFKIQSKDIIVITDPFQKTSGLTPLRTRADIVTISNDSENHNNIKDIKDNPFIIDGPGEYERKGVFIKGIASFHDNKEGEELGPNTVFIFEIEKIKICHLGALGHKLSSKQIERIDAVDILLAPVGEKNTLKIGQLMDVINDIGPRIVVPMNYFDKRLKEKLNTHKDFLSEMGQENIKPEPKLTIKKKDMPTDETKIALLDIAR
jgi:L-ascorbate metabolism protein UlaG (beta-lactamase superfamily)